MNVKVGEVHYRAEGNANLVIALRGTNKVLRLPKSKYTEKSQLEKLEAIENYINGVIQPLFGDYVSKVCVVNLNHEQLETIQKIVAPKRPEKRLSKNIFYPAGLLMPDHCFLSDPGEGPTLSVEIKPKLGYINPKVSQGKSCNYCLKQQYKFLESDRNYIKSQYCPLDLFSGVNSRMLEAFNNLMMTPKNNLRIFKDGTLLHDENNSSNIECDTFLASTIGNKTFLPHTLVSILTSEPGSGDIHLDLDSKSIILNTNRQGYCNSISKSLPKKCILSSILSLQKMDITDSEADNLLNELISAGFDIKYLQNAISDNNIDNENLSDDLLNKIKKLKNYAISVTARDLSVIVTLAPEVSGRETKEGSWIVINKKVFRYQVSIIDLDPKSLTKIKTYVENRLMWVNSTCES